MFLRTLVPLLLIATIASASSGVAKALEGEIKKSKIPSAHLGVVVFDEHAQPVYGVNENSTMIPASLTKLLTAAVTLKVFAPGTKFETQLVSDGNIKKGVLEGNLYFKGGGDPSFVSEKMWYLVNEFVRNEVHEITGSVIVDDTLFDAERFDPGRDPNRVNRAYDAPIGAASFNWNSVNVYIRPGAKSGEPATVFADPQSPYITLENKVKTVASGLPNITIDRVDGANGDTIKVSGTVAAGKPEIVKYVSVSKPDLWTGYHLVEFLKQRGISVRGNISVGKAPSKAVVLAKAEGAPIYEILADMLKFSNNYIAEMLTKQFAVNAGIVPGTMSAGLKSMNSSLQSLGLSTSDFSLTSPSGLSQNNKIKVKSLGALLATARRNLRMFPELAAGLPLAGTDGTLKSRMKGTAAEQRVRGKTGLLTGAMGLAGYAGRDDGTTLTYVFLYNGPQDNTVIWPLFDAMAARLVE